MQNQLISIILSFATVVTTQAAADRFVQKIHLPAGLTAVVAEGDLEARSIGSFTVRLYSREHAQAGDDTTFFLSGIIRKRDGTIEKIEHADIDGDGKPELIVLVRSAGTGQYISADAFGFDNTCIWLHAAVANVAYNTDAIAALKKAKPNRKVPLCPTS